MREREEENRAREGTVVCACMFAAVLTDEGGGQQLAECV